MNYPCDYRMVHCAALGPYDAHVLRWQLWLLAQGHVLVTAPRAAGFTTWFENRTA